MIVLFKAGLYKIINVFLIDNHTGKTMLPEIENQCKLSM